MKSYKLINRTKFPREIIKILIELACPSGVDNFSITLLEDKQDCPGAYGKAYVNRKHVKVWFGYDEEYPALNTDTTIEKYGYKPNFIIRNEEEELLSTIAHELRHLWQIHVSKRNFRDGKIHSYTHWDKKKYMSIEKMESDACQYAYKMVKEYRNAEREYKKRNKIN